MKENLAPWHQGLNLAQTSRYDGANAGWNDAGSSDFYFGGALAACRDG